MTEECALLLYFLQFVSDHCGKVVWEDVLEEPEGVCYAPRSVAASAAEAEEAEEIAAFVDTASALRVRPPAPSAEIRITRGMRIYIGEKELKIRPMSKAVLLLFLLHPEGIRLKSIGDYSEELNRLYSAVTRSDDPNRIHTRVARVLDIFSNELNVNLSRVNAALSALENGAKYMVHGKAGESKSITFNSTSVVWE